MLICTSHSISFAAKGEFAHRNDFPSTNPAVPSFGKASPDPGVIVHNVDSCVGLDVPKGVCGEIIVVADISILTVSQN